ncbi:MAG: thioesterase-like protein [Rhodospirillaceae bacterium]|nr:thioesterase-like protein [Rhodospirillaceae bacterium]
MRRSSPFSNCQLSVLPEWIDYNGHMNVGFYGVAFDKATDALLDHIGAGEDYRQRENASTFVLEAHLTYDREVGNGDPLRFDTLVVDADRKRMHVFHTMYHDAEGYLAATNELMILHVDLSIRRAAPFPMEMYAKIENMVAQSKGLDRPTRMGRIIGIRP